MAKSSMKSLNTCFIPDEILKDGRYVEYKRSVPSNMDHLIKIAVAMANTNGGIIIFGRHDKISQTKRKRINLNEEIPFIKDRLNNLTVGVDYDISTKDGQYGPEIHVDIKKSLSTAYFARKESTPERQYAYSFKEDDKGNVLLGNICQMLYKKIYKYMPIETFMSSLYNNSWRFFEPSIWSDKFEQRFYCARYMFPAASGNTPQVFATCVTRERNSEAAWKVYSRGQALGAHCLQLELDVLELRRQIIPNKIKFEEKLIDYVSETTILNLHKKKGPHYKEYFSKFSADSFLRLLSLKRRAYEYEKEVRFFLIPNLDKTRNTSKKACHYDIIIDWSKIITKVRVDKKCTDAELKAIQQACFAVGIDPVIDNYTFMGPNIKPAGLKTIPFELYDIDDMPGPTRIKIR